MQTKNNYQLEWEVVSKYGIPVDRGVGIFNGDMGILKPVSYTHLDVYKRQEIVSEDECNDTYGRIRMYQALLLKQPEGVHIPLSLIHISGTWQPLSP